MRAQELKDVVYEEVIVADRKSISHPSWLPLPSSRDDTGDSPSPFLAAHRMHPWCTCFKKSLFSFCVDSV